MQFKCKCTFWFTVCKPDRYAPLNLIGAIRFDAIDMAAKEVK